MKDDKNSDNGVYAAMSMNQGRQASERVVTFPQTFAYVGYKQNTPPNLALLSSVNPSQKQLPDLARSKSVT